MGQESDKMATATMDVQRIDRSDEEEEEEEEVEVVDISRKVSGK